MKKPALHLVCTTLVTGVLSAADWPQQSPFGPHYWVVASTTIQPALDVNQDGKPDTDLRVLVPACERDDADRYMEDGTIVTDRGTDTCDDGEERREETGTWSYDPKTRTLVMEKYDGSRPVHAQVESASAGQLVIVSQHPSAQGNHTIRTTLKVKKTS